jgi:hypothetical protein
LTSGEELIVAQWLFPESVVDSKNYTIAKHFWHGLWQRVLKRTGLGGMWTSPWMENPVPDGNPIFTAVLKFKARGVRIIHEDVGDPDDTDLDWWVDSFGEKTAPDAVPELVIACCPSRSNIVEVERLLSEWVQEGKVSVREPEAIYFSQEWLYPVGLAA